MKTATLALTAALLLALLLLQPASGPARAELGHYDATASLTLTSTATGAARGETLTLSVPSGDFNTADTILFEPSAVTVTPGCNKAGFRDFNNDDVIDTGETPCLTPGGGAGTNTWSGMVGVVNGPCNSPLTTVYDLFDVATPNNELAPRASTNIVYPRPQGSGDRFGGWAVGAEPPPLGGTPPIDADAFGNAEGGSLAFQAYPSYLLDLFDPDGAGPANPVLPRAVYGGLTRQSGEWMPFYYLQFEAGALGTAFAAESPHPYSNATAAVGQPGVLVVGDPTATTPSQSTTTDLCSAVTSTLVLNATVGATNRAVNPAIAGTHMAMTWQIAGRDTDNDGYENTLDTCPAMANLENPRTTNGPDSDMLDSACDPSPGVTNIDPDTDGWVNALDNCPLVSNPTQADGEIAVPADYAASAFDGGPLGDGIGSACDSGSLTITQNGKSTIINLSSAVANGHYHIAANPLPKCYGGTDADGDGYCAGTTDGADSGACTTAFPPNCAIRHSSWTNFAADAPLLELDTDRAGADTTTAADPAGGCVVRPSCAPTIACPGGVSDLCPENGFDSDHLEAYVGTNPAQACSQDTTPNNEPYDSWIYDFNDDQRANLSDIVVMGPAFGRFINGPGGNVRFDINSDGAANLSDVTRFGFVFNKQCRRVDGTFGPPQ